MCVVLYLFCSRCFFVSGLDKGSIIFRVMTKDVFRLQKEALEMKKLLGAIVTCLIMMIFIFSCQHAYADNEITFTQSEIDSFVEYVNGLADYKKVSKIDAAYGTSWFSNELSNCGYFATFCVSHSVLANKVNVSRNGTTDRLVMWLANQNCGTFVICTGKANNSNTVYNQYYNTNYNRGYVTNVGRSNIVINDNYQPVAGDIVVFLWPDGSHIGIMTSPTTYTHASGSISTESSSYTGVFKNTNINGNYNSTYTRKDCAIIFFHFNINNQLPKVEVSFEAPFYAGNVFEAAATFSQAWTITRNGKSIQPDDFYYNVYDSAGNFVGKVYNTLDSKFRCGTYESEITLSSYSEYSVESHVIVDGIDYASERYPFSTEGGDVWLVDYLWSSKQISTYSIQATLDLRSDVTPVEYLTGVGWYLYDDNDNLVFEQHYTIGVDTPLGTRVEYYNHYSSGFHWQPWDSSLGRQGSYEVFLPVNISFGLHPGQTYHFVPYMTREHEPLFAQKTNLYFTTLSSKPTEWRYTLKANDITSTSVDLFCEMVAGRKVGEENDFLIWPYHHTLTLYDANGMLVAEWSKEESFISNLRVYLFIDHVKSFDDLNVTLSPGSMYTAVFEDEWYEMVIQSDPVSFYTNSIVEYNANGGECAPAASEKTYGEALVLSDAEPTRAGYLFMGWATSSDAQSPQYQPGDELEKDGAIVLYALWKKLKPDFILPTFLTSIDAEAFSGLSMTVVKCPDTLKSIGPKAFADCKKLRVIYLPADIENIDVTAFSGCSNVVVYGKSSTVAEAIAYACGFTFIPYE